MRDRDVPPASCPYCRFAFDPGSLRGAAYCPKCGCQYTLEQSPDSVEDTAVLAEMINRDVKAMVAAPNVFVPRSFGSFDLLDEAGRGGMGIVYRAFDRRLRRVVALKVLREGTFAGHDDRRRLQREASTASRLTHPHIVPVHECSIFRGQPYFTMDFVEGISLEQCLHHGPMSPHEACRLLDAVARAMAYAHEQGVVHRDLKPANILIAADGLPRITDFGLAVRMHPEDESRRVTRHGEVLGTLPYMSPEQAAGRLNEIDTRSDVYSLGAVLYECLTGRPPFVGGWSFDLQRRVIHEMPPSPRSLRPRLPRSVERIVMKCLAKAPAQRYPSALALAEECRAIYNEPARRSRTAWWSWMLRPLIKVAIF